MDLQTLFNFFGGVATLLVCGYVRFVQNQLNDSRVAQSDGVKDLSDFKVKVAENYVTHNDLRRIEDALIRIEAKIDVKQDKS